MTPWPRMKVGRVARLISGVGFPHQYQGKTSGVHPFLKVSDLASAVSGYHLVTSQNWVGQADLVSLGARLAPKGAIVFPKVGAAMLKNPRRLLDLPAAMDNNLMAVVPSSGEPRFWLYALSTIDLGEFSAGGALPYVNEGQIRDLHIPFPSVEQQRRIADFLDAETARIDHLTRLRNKQVSTLEERYGAAISELTTPGISTSERRSSIWPWLPEELTTVRLGYLARVQSGVTVHNARTGDSEDATFPYLRVANVQGEAVDLTEIKEITVPRPMAMRSMLHPGDVVMTEANGNPDNLGRGAVWRGEIANMIHQNHVFAIRVDREKLIPEYLSALLAASHGRRYFRFTSAQVGIATTSSSKVLNFPVPARTTSQQTAVVREYETLRSAANRAQSALMRQLSLLTERRQALITAAVTGQFDVSTASGRNVTEGVSA
ncbi:restriction endonuclease subunit S [Streptomyces griseoaurantiacus]|uniref:Type I restriction enzyme, S subunit n=1 Tax=Streptomyces griseoaurantiacus TaxID=68213 RepID=A0A1G7INM7_9ACTN|nr:restriction endonuclease subunit S [Streptomyces jietaisiensis]SDF14362.1 type I restriction enzyme, S subunit [Streptomyces jietaisiensis]